MTLDDNSIGQVEALHHHNQFMEAIGTVPQNFKIEVDFGRSRQRVKTHRSRRMPMLTDKRPAPFNRLALERTLPLKNLITQCHPGGDAEVFGPDIGGDR